MKILFIYPNKEGYPIIPMGICVLSGVLKKAGHTTDVFDITFMVEKHVDHEAREKTHSVLPVDVEKYWKKFQKVDILAEFKKKIDGFQPDLVAISIVENNYFWAKTLIDESKKLRPNVPVVVGGLFPTVYPDLFIDNPNINYTCIGDGEYALKDLVYKLENKLKTEYLTFNIATKDNRQPCLAEYYKWEDGVFPDWEIFDERHIMKPFMGKMWRTGFFETSRGCPFNCSYCLNDLLQDEFKNLGRYNRSKPLDLLFNEMIYFKDKYNLELIFFNDENFLTTSKERLIKFCDEYKAKINLPFFIATRADSLLNEDKIKLLKEAGCITIGIGVECGNETFRNTILNKRVLDKTIIQAFENCKEVGVRTTCNMMIGLPFETEENILESIKFCKKLNPASIGLSVFAPYYGTKLREICVKNNFMEDKIYEDIAIINDSILTMSQLSKEKIDFYYHNFLDLVYKK